MISGLMLTVAAALMSDPAQALIGHETIIAFTPENGVETRSRDVITDQSAPITTSITASIAGGFGPALNSISPLGNLGMWGEFYELGRIDSDILIQNTGIENISGRAQFARANFIIDGGFLQFFGGPGSNLEFLLTVTSRITDGLRNEFTTCIELVHDVNGIQTILFSGEDIGAAFNPVRAAVEIPRFFGSLDIGLVDPGGISIWNIASK